MSSPIAYPVRYPDWILTYSGVNITADISHMVLSISHVDELGGRSGELEITLEDRERRWQGPWFPQQADLVSLLIGYSGELLLPCGEFQVDDLEVEGPPDVFHLRCLPAWITPSLRTRNSFGYENQTLLQIAASIAARHGMTVVGASNQLDVSYLRITQKQETDLEFLHRIAIEHDYDFTVRGAQLVFYSRASLEAQPAALTLYRNAVEHFSFVAKTHRIYKQAQAAYFDPEQAVIHANRPGDSRGGDRRRAEGGGALREWAAGSGPGERCPARSQPFEGDVPARRAGHDAYWWPAMSSRFPDGTLWTGVTWSNARSIGFRAPPAMSPRPN